MRWLVAQSTRWSVSRERHPRTAQGAALRRQPLEGRLLAGVGPPAEMGHAGDLLPVGDHRGQEGVAALQKLPDRGDGHRTHPRDLAHLAFGGPAAQERGEVDAHDHPGPAAPCRSATPGQLGQGVGRVGLDRLTLSIVARRSEQPIADRLQGGHHLGPDLGVVAHPQVPRPLGVDVAAQVPAAVDPRPAGLGIGTGRRLGPGALGAQLGQRRLSRRRHQPLPGAGIGGGRVGQRRRLLGGDRSGAGGGAHHA